MQPIRHGDAESKVSPSGFLVVLNKQNGCAYTLTPMAALMWEFCDGAHTLEQIVSEIIELKQDFDASETEFIPSRPGLRAALDQFVDEFREHGLLIVGKSKVDQYIHIQRQKTENFHNLFLDTDSDRKAFATGH